MMNQNKKSKLIRVVASGLLGMIMLTTIPVSAGTKITKEENIYANLAGDGLIDDVYVVNEFNLSQKGNIVDYGNYISTRNLTSESKIENSKGEITTTASKGKFDYQGTLETADIPWLFDISYALDGKDISPDELAGVKGKLEIKIRITKNESVDATFFESYLLQVGLNLPTNNCSNVKAKGATLANNGDKKQVTFNVMAGQEKTLTVQTDVKNFEMDAITFKGVPMSFDIDTDSLGVDELTSKTDQLTDGVAKLKSGSSKLSSGGSALESGMSQYKEGMEILQTGSKALTKATKQLDSGVSSYINGVGKIAQGSTKLSNEKTGAVVQIDSALKTIRQGLAKMKVGLETMNSNGIAPMIAGLENQESSIKSLVTAMDGVETGLNKLSSVSSEYESEATALKKIIDSFETSSSTKTSEDTTTGEYKEDKTDTSKEESVDEEGNKVTTITNNIYMTKIDTKTVKSQTSQGSSTSDMTNLYQRMQQNQAVLSAILNGQGSTPGLASIISRCSQGVTKLNTAMFEDTSSSTSLKTGLKTMQSQLTGKNGAIDNVEAMIKGVDQLQKSISGSGENSLKTSLLTLNNGLLQLNQNSTALTSGTSQLTSGSAKLTSGVSTVTSKTVSLQDGVSTLVGGNKSLEAGINELDSKTSGIGDKVQDTIDKKVDELSGKNYKATSFVSTKNKNVTAVQFVMKTQAVEIPEKKETKKTEKEKTWLEKLLVLFK